MERAKYLAEMAWIALISNSNAMETAKATTRPDCNEIRGVNYRQMVSDVAHKDLVPVRWNNVR